MASRNNLPVVMLDMVYRSIYLFNLTDVPMGVKTLVRAHGFHPKPRLGLAEDSR